VREAKGQRDVHRYKAAWDCIRHVAPGELEAGRDDTWIEQTERENKAETARLESELKGYKNNLIKESIRVSGSLKYGIISRQCGSWFTDGK
jgi:COP9 signalosome complex subunit 1